MLPTRIRQDRTEHVLLVQVTAGALGPETQTKTREKDFTPEMVPLGTRCLREHAGRLLKPQIWTSCRSCIQKSVKKQR